MRPCPWWTGSIDQAVLHGQEKVDIIHGVGTGRLKRAVWDPPEAPHPGQRRPRRRQPRGDGGGFEGLRNGTDRYHKIN